MDGWMSTACLQCMEVQRLTTSNFHVCDFSGITLNKPLFLCVFELSNLNLFLILKQGRFRARSPRHKRLAAVPAPPPRRSRALHCRIQVRGLERHVQQWHVEQRHVERSPASAARRRRRAALALMTTSNTSPALFFYDLLWFYDSRARKCESTPLSDVSGRRRLQPENKQEQTNKQTNTNKGHWGNPLPFCFCFFAGCVFKSKQKQKQLRFICFLIFDIAEALIWYFALILNLRNLSFSVCTVQQLFILSPPCLFLLCLFVCWLFSKNQINLTAPS